MLAKVLRTFSASSIHQEHEPFGSSAAIH